MKYYCFGNIEKRVKSVYLLQKTTFNKLKFYLNFKILFKMFKNKEEKKKRKEMHEM